MNLYGSKKQKLKFRLSNVWGMLRLTCDVWTACTNLGYICLTAHFVDENWKLNSKILAFCSMPPPHSGIEIARKVYHILADWKIDRKVFSLTLDSSSANNDMVEILKMRLGLQNSLLCNGEFFRVKCCSHLLTLMVQEGLEVASEALDKIRDSIKYVKASEARMIKFKECARKTGIELPSSLCLDVPTHWESIYLMFDSGIKCRRVFCLLEFEDLAYMYRPTEEEWNRELMLKFLEPFYNISTMISGSSSPTSGFFFLELWKIAHFVSINYRSQDEEVKSMSHSMNLKFAPYWEEHSEILSRRSVRPKDKTEFKRLNVK
ncbi:zinc finger BED domain-containing protein RICESLEEPER 2-like [Salvia splendens]|uniref:zinc finger BED domain-containing protein RICESLEEPER 2-like n=1 Tax=Salvia splendens TaxID=180675 RepID=UPI001C257A4F|nr:zinc finger BED domain-containing protein RICESLEEPER 2-like [Salvia splendens]XP_042036821.1 zinc finger BED domain-containing protein RICESLEEPER 2-like [Salvia splendens]